MDSIWRKMNHNPEKLAFSGHIQTEAAVIGGGMAGILTAFFLQEAGIKTILLDIFIVNFLFPLILIHP